MKSRSIGSLILLAALSPCCGTGGAGGPIFLARWSNLYRLPATVDLHVVSCDGSAKNVLVAGDAGTILLSQDGGQSWIQVDGTPASRDGDILAIGAASTSVILTGVASSTPGTAAWTSTDSINWINSEDPKFGEPWVGVALTVPTTNTTPGSSYRLRPSGLVDLYEGGFLRTVDSKNALLPPAPPPPAPPPPPNPPDGTWTSANSIIFFGISGVGLVAGSDGTGNGQVRRTIDNGQGWDTLKINDGALPPKPITVPPLRRLLMGSPNSGFVCGDGGTVLGTTDGNAFFRIPNNPGLTGDLRGLSFPVDFNTGWVVGLGGAIYKLFYDGVKWNWVDQNPGGTVTTVNLYDVIFADNNTGYAAGAQGTLLKTINGGTTWTVISKPTGTLPQFNAVDFTKNAATGLVVDNAGGIVRTLDTGLDWTSFNQGGVVTGALKGVSIPHGGSANIAYVCGTNVWKQTSLRGSTPVAWTLQSPAAGAYRAILFPAGDQKGVVVGNTNAFLKTTDGGTTWTAPAGTAPPNPANWAALCPGLTGTLVFAAGNNGANGVLASSDISGSSGTDSWTTLPGLTGVTINAIQAPLGSTTHVFAGGGDGKVYRLNAAETTWDGGVQVIGTNTSVVSLAFISEQHGWAVVEDTAAGSQGGVFETIDGGTTWTRSYLHVKVSNTALVRAIWMNSSQTGFVVGDNGWIFGTLTGGD